MGLIALQPVLARLYTDTAFREAFLADPSFGAAQGLSVADVDTIMRLNAAQVEAFAGSLIAKRRNEVSKLLPVSCAMLGERFPALFAHHADRYVPSGIRKHNDDAVSFADFIAGAAGMRGLRADASGRPLAGLIVDILRYEAAWLRAADPAFRWRVMRFGHDVDDALASAGDRTDMRESRAGTSLHVWFRLPLGDRLFHLAIGRPRPPSQAARPAPTP